MHRRLDDLIVVASGSASRVAGWVALLRANQIQYVSATSCVEPEDESPDYVELWVHEKDAKRAREILKAASDGPSLW